MDYPSSSSGGGAIPEDVVFQILLWLPVSALLRFRSICKSWLSIIDSPAFISGHVHRISDWDDNNHSLNLIVSHEVVNRDTSYNFSFYSTNDRQQPKIAWFSPDNGELIGCEATIISSFQGIVCLKILKYGRFDVLFLWNPATRQSALLPPSPKCGRCRVNCFCPTQYGFGFDVKTKDYKVVKLVFGNIPLENRVEVYCLSTDSWRTLDDPGLLTNFVVVSNPKRPFLKRIHCWLGFYQPSNNYSILSFDFSNETFGVIPGPQLTPCIVLLPVLTFLREKIAIIDRAFDYSGHARFHLTTWVLNECSAKESWTKLYTVTLDQVSIDQPLGFSTDGKLILYAYKNPHAFYLYDPLTQEVNEVTIQAAVYYVTTYKESLISVKSSNGVVKRAAYSL